MTEQEVANWLQSFYSRDGAEQIEDDLLGTTLVMCGAVVVASMLSATTSPERLANITGLPIAFTAVVMANMDFNRFWTDESLIALGKTLNKDRIDHQKVKSALDWFQEEFWCSSDLPGMDKILPALRGRCLLHGKTQTGFDNDLRCELFDTF